MCLDLFYDPYLNKDTSSRLESFKVNHTNEMENTREEDSPISYEPFDDCLFAVFIGKYIDVFEETFKEYLVGDFNIFEGNFYCSSSQSY